MELVLVEPFQHSTMGGCRQQAGDSHDGDHQRTADQRPATTASASRVHRNTCCQECFQVASGSRYRHFELLRQFSCRDALVALQDQESCHEAIGAHDLIIAYKVIRT